MILAAARTLQAAMPATSSTKAATLATITIAIVCSVYFLGGGTGETGAP
jgi:hypothetical protein